MKQFAGIPLLPLALAATVFAPFGAAQAPPLQKGVSVQMPVTTHAAPMPAADQPDAVVVAITARRSVYFGITPVTPAVLAEKIKAALPGRANSEVFVKSDARATYARVGEVLAELRAAGVDRPNLLTSQPEPPQPGKLVPPKGLQVRTSPAPSGSIVIQALSAGVRIDNEPVSAAALESALERRFRNRSEKDVVVKAGGALPFGDVVHIIDVCRSTGAAVFLAAPAMD